jgi:4-oxalocrotonate tautomerase
MPFVNVGTAKGMLDEAQKKALQARITDVMVELEGGGDPAFRPFVWVLIEEHEPRHWSVGGTQVTEELIAQLTRRAAAEV